MLLLQFYLQARAGVGFAHQFTSKSGSCAIGCRVKANVYTELKIVQLALARSFLDP